MQPCGRHDVALAERSMEEKRIDRRLMELQ